METATQPLGAPGAEIATQPVQAPSSFPEVQPTGEGDVSAASDSEADQLSDTGSLDEEIHRDRSADRDVSRDDPDSEPTEEANYRETMGGVRSFMNWHKVPEFETVSSTADDNPFAVARVRPTGKVSVKLPVDDWLCRKMLLLLCYYYVFILSAISPYTTGLKALFNQSGCTIRYSPNSQVTHIPLTGR